MDNLFVPFNPQVGRPRKYTPKQLLAKFEEYINDRLNRPIIERETETARHDEHRSEKESRVSHPQLLSIGDFCIFLGCCRNWWNELPDEFLGVKRQISTYIEQYQLRGASLGIFNANIISRLLGLTEKKDITSNGETIQAIVQSQEQKEKLDNIKDLDI